MHLVSLLGTKLKMDCYTEPNLHACIDHSCQGGFVYARGLLVIVRVALYKIYMDIPCILKLITN